MSWLLTLGVPMESATTAELRGFGGENVSKLLHARKQVDLQHCNAWFI